MADETGVLFGKDTARRVIAEMLKSEKAHEPPVVRGRFKPPPMPLIQLELTQILVGNHFAKGKIVYPSGTYALTGEFNDPIIMTLMEEEYWIKGYTEVYTDKWDIEKRGWCFHHNGFFNWAVPKGCPGEATEGDTDTARTQSLAAMLELFGAAPEEE